VSENPIDSKKTLAVIIAGGQSRRMKGHLGIKNKFSLPLGSGSILNFIRKRLSPQIDNIMINANDIIEDLALDILPDIREEMHGPLSGILTALRAAKERGYTQVLTLACDTPFFPDDFLEKLQKYNAPIILAQSGGRIHPLMGLWDVDLITNLTNYLDQGQRKVMGFTEEHSYELCKWQNDPYDPFFNINDAQDLNLAQEILKTYF
jgi:molybdopterin-guanine dinucleotide biosynthesis protein A